MVGLDKEKLTTYTIAYGCARLVQKANRACSANSAGDFITMCWVVCKPKKSANTINYRYYGKIPALG